MLRRTLPSRTMSTSDIVGKHCYKTWAAQKGWKPLTIAKAEGCYFWDDNGKKYFDLNSQLMCSNLGHQNKAVCDAIAAQAHKLSFVAPSFATEVRAELIQKLLPIVPKGMDKFFFPTSGTEANEAAVKMARIMTGKYKIISRYNSYHGATTATIACTGDFRRWMAEHHHNVTNGHIMVPEVNKYRPGPLGTTDGTAQSHIDHLEYILQNENEVAAIIAEPVVGTNGVLVPPDDYFPKLRALTKKYGVLLIADEVMAGWGRCGEWFSINKWDVTPDILCTAKGLTNAQAPLGMVATTREVADFFEEGWFCHGHTYESHPLVLAPAVAAIGEFQRLDLINKSKTNGAIFGEKLRTLMKNHPCVGDVRGIGMFYAVEIVKNRETKEPFGTQRDQFERKVGVIAEVAKCMMDNGVYCFGSTNHFMCAPPLIMTEEDMDFVVSVFDKALTIADKHVKV